MEGRCGSPRTGNAYARSRVVKKPRDRASVASPRPLIHGAAEDRGQLPGQQVALPHDAAAAALGKHLDGRIVVGHPAADDRIHEASRLVVDIHDQLLDRIAAGKCDVAGVAFEPGVHDKPGREARVDGADVAERVPHLRRPELDGEFLSDERHNASSRRQTPVIFARHGSTRWRFSDAIIAAGGEE